MAIQKFTGRIVGTPKELETANTHRKVVHVTIDFAPDMSEVNIFGGKLPTIKENEISRVQLSFWDEKFQQAIMSDVGKLENKMVTGYCDAITQRNQFYNGTGYAFVVAADNAKPVIPIVQVITRSAAPVAPVAPV